MPTTAKPNPERHGIEISPPIPILYPVDALPLVRAAVLVAEHELLRGVREVPPGSNLGKDVEEYQIGLYGTRERYGYLVGKQWCARGARYWYERGGQDVGEPRPFKGWRAAGAEHDSDLASATKIYDCAENLGKLVDVDEARFGDLGLFIAPNHVVLIVGRRPDGWLQTIEANFRHKVAMVWRDPSELAAVARVASS